MRLSLFLEMAVPRPWGGTTELRRFDEALEEVELADKVGFHAAWATEHHFLEEMAHTSAPETLLAALARTTKNIRLGHGIMNTIPGINHPARVAERIATLDVISHGRVEFGTGEGSSVAELDGFRIDPGRKRDMWLEGTKAAIRCLSETPFRGAAGEFVSMPPRNVVPKPLQKPHPPVWVACTRPATMEMAGRYAIGALSFSRSTVIDQVAQQVKTYERAFESAVPLGQAINARTLFTAGNLCAAKDTETARQRVGWKGGFFGYGVQHYYTGQTHRPGREDLWDSYRRIRMGERPPLSPDGVPATGDRKEWKELADATVEAELEAQGGVGDIRRIREFVLANEAAGADELMFLLPAIDSEFNLETIEIVGKELIPEIHERDERLAREKANRLAPVFDAIEARREEEPSPYPEEYSFSGVPKAWESGVEHDEIRQYLRRMAGQIALDD